MAAPDLNHPDFASFYDELPLWSAPFAARILERAPLTPGQTIVDLGCGTGFLSLELAQRCGPRARVYAVDPWPAAMARLARKLSYRGVENVTLVQRDGVDTGLADGVVDLIVCNLGINNFPDPEAVLAECRRVLKPGGRLMMTSNLKGHMAQVYAALREVLGELGLGDRSAALAAHEDHRGTTASVVARLTAAGFAEVTFEASSYPMRFADGTAMLGHWFMRMAFIPDWLAASGDDPRILPALETRLNAVATAEGELALTIPVALFEARKGP